MRLWNQIVKYKFKKYADDQLNGKTNIWDFYQAYTMSKIALNEEINKKRLLNMFWKIYIGKHKLRNKLDVVINRRMLNIDIVSINKFLKETKKYLQSEELIEENYGAKGVIGVASYYYDD